MKVSAAVASRKSIRAFKSDPVPLETIKDILRLAHRAPSGSNLQPWRVYVLAGDTRDAFVEAIERSRIENPEGEGMERPIHPPDLSGLYKARYMSAGERLYGAMGVERSDADGRYQHRCRGWRFFGAPVGLIFTVHRQMLAGQWADVGMFVQSIMLLAREHGLDTCAQETWVLWPKTIRSFLSLPDDEAIYCGMAIGYADDQAPVNQFESERVPFEDYVTIVGDAG